MIADQLTAHMSREQELLLWCARTELEPPLPVRIGERVEDVGIDWASLLATARRHRVTAPLYRSLDYACERPLPRLVREQLRSWFAADSGHNHLLVEELSTIVAKLDRDDVATIPYMGPLVAVSVYDDLALRPFDELDLIVVDAVGVWKAKQLLVRRGYRRTEALDDGAEQAWLRNHARLDFVRDDDGARIALRTGVLADHYSYPFDTRRMFARADRAKVVGRSLRTLAPEDLLLVLCTYGGARGWRPLQLLCDVAELVRAHGDDLDWTHVLAEAEFLGATRTLSLGLFLAHGLLDAAPPEEIWREVSTDVATCNLAEAAAERLFDVELPSDFEQSVFYLRTREKLRDRVAYVGHRVRSSVAPRGLGLAPGDEPEGDV